MTKLRQLQVIPSVSSQAEARNDLQKHGDAVVVERDIPRTLVLNCPDGCGEVLTVNLDKRTGKAWRLYRDENGLTLFPSVWRDTGCESHFIIWDNMILWLDGSDQAKPRSHYKTLGESVLGELSFSESRSFVDVADSLHLIPWRVQRICEKLVRDGKVLEDDKPRRGNFRRV